MPAWSNDSNETFYLGFILSKFCDLKTGMLGKLTYNNKELHFCQHDIIISNKIADPSCHRFPWWIRAPKRCPERWGKDSMRPLWDQCSGRFAKIKIWVRYHWGPKCRYRENRWRYITSVGTVSRMLFFLCHGSQRNCCCELEGTVQGYVSMFHSFPYSAYRLWHGQGQTFWPPHSRAHRKTALQMWNVQKSWESVWGSLVSRWNLDGARKWIGVPYFNSEL